MHLTYLALCPELNYISNHLLEKNNNDIINIGFISSHFYDHSIGRILFETIYFIQKEALENRQKFRLTVYLLEQYDLKEDQILFYFKKYIHRFVRFELNTPLSAIRDSISQDKLFILLYSDIGMDLSTYLLAHSRLANYQVNKIYY